MRARALRAPVFLGSLTRQTGRCAPPPTHRSFATSPRIKIIVQKQNASLLTCTRATRGVYLSIGPPRLRNIIFPAPRPTYRTLLSYSAPSWALLHPKGLYAAPNWAMLHILCYAALYLATLHLTELHCTWLSYAAPIWAKLHPIELRCTLLSYAAPY